MTEQDLPLSLPLIPPAEFSLTLGPWADFQAPEPSSPGKKALGSDDSPTWTRQCVLYKAIYHCGFPGQTNTNHLPAFLERFAVGKKMCTEASSH